LPKPLHTTVAVDERVNGFAASVFTIPDVI